MRATARKRFRKVSTPRTSRARKEGITRTVPVPGPGTRSSAGRVQVPVLARLVLDQVGDLPRQLEHEPRGVDGPQDHRTPWALSDPSPSARYINRWPSHRSVAGEIVRPAPAG